MLDMGTRTKLLGAACAFIFISLLVACLWPFHAPKNEAFWLARHQGMRFAGYGTVLSRGPVIPAGGSPQDSWSVEIWLQSYDPDQSSTILAFYNPGRPSGLALRQSETDLVVEDERWNQASGTQAGASYTNNVFGSGSPVLLTLVSGPARTTLYVDGIKARTAPRFRLSTADVEGQLVLANSPVGNDSWKGEMRGLAIYNCELSQAQTLRHYAAWIQTGQPDVKPDERAAGLYLFNEGSGTIIRDHLGSGADLYIPKRYLEVRQAFLARPWDEYDPGWDYWIDVLMNVAGFMPLGFLLYAYLWLGLGVRRAALVTILAGALLSLTVEILQAYLPTRDSGMTDIITNTLGTGLGVAVCRWTSTMCARLSASPHPGVQRLASLLAPSERT